MESVRKNLVAKARQNPGRYLGFHPDGQRLKDRNQLGSLPDRLSGKRR
jgi:hypothetical protein